VRVLEIPTPEGVARAHVRPPAGEGGSGALVLGHGAGGGIGAPDLLAAVRVAVGLGWWAVLVEQPWRVAGRRVAPLPPRLDTAWLPVLDALPAAGGLPAGPLVVGGRSAGARVACRTAVRTGARAVLALAFPLHPPGRPERSRRTELEEAGVPVVAVQGRRDPFGRPEELEELGLAHVDVVAVDGDHGLTAGRAVSPGVTDAVGRLLAAVR
jgi:hypothetical protein